MAITRIQNNQVTDASAGNVYLGVNAAAKVQDYSITAGKIQNNLTYGSDLTITGNLTVQGNTTTIDTVNLVVEDPLILLAKEQTGSPTLDIGFIGKRGTADNIAFVWDESADEFVTVFTTSETTNTTISINAYASLRTLDMAVTGNLAVTGNTSFTGNITSLAVTGNIDGGNLRTPGLVTATGNVTGGNLNTGGAVSATGNVNSGNVNTGIVSATGNINGTGAVFSGNVSAANFIGNISGNIDAAGSNTQVQFNDTGDILGASANFTFNKATNIMTVTGTIQGTTLSATGNVIGGNVTTAGLVSATGNVTGGNITTSGNVDATSAFVNAGAVLASGRVEAGTTMSAGGNITSAGNVVATANVIGGNLSTAGVVSATGNVNGGNVNTAKVASSGGITISSGGSSDLVLDSAGNINADSNYINNVGYPVQNADAASKLYVDNMVSSGLTYHQAVVAATTANLATTTGGTITYNQPNGAGNGIGATITTTGSFNLIDTANVQTANTRILVKDEGNAVLNGVYYWANATAIIRTTDADEYGPNSVDQLSYNDYFFVQSGNINKGSAWVVDAPTGTITFGTSNIAFAQFSSSQTYTANTQAGIDLNGTVFSAKVDNNTTAFDGGGNISVKAGANLTTPNIGAATGTSLSVTGNVTGGNLNTGGLVTATGNVTGGNITTGGVVSATGNVNSGNVNTGIVSGSGNVTGANFLTTGLVTATGNVTGGNLLTAGLISATGNINSDANVVATANVVGGNISTAGLITATGNVTGGNINTGGLVTATGNVTGGNLNTAGLVTATGNVTGGNVNTAGLVTATGNVTGGNINTAGIVTATGNITGANLILTSGTIDGPAAGRITINGSDLDTDFAVDGDTTSNIFYVDAGTGTASFGTSAQTTNAIVAFNATNSILMPVGNTAQRPGTGVLGMLRFNSTGDVLEVYTSGGWEDVGVPAFTVITADSFSGNGVQTNFTLSANSTTAATIVSINGVVQIPTTAYSVSGNSLQFTEAPGPSDSIDARLLTTTTTVTAIENTSGNASIMALDTSAAIEVLGNLLPAANVTYNLGSPTAMWNNAYFNGTTIFLGNLQLKQVNATTFGVFLADGTTQANVDVGAIDVSAITNGTSNIAIPSTNGNATISVGGTANVLTVTTTGIVISGSVSASSFVGLDATKISNGTSEMAVIASGGNIRANIGGSTVEVIASDGVRVTGIVSASGNVTGANINTGGLVTATGNVTGGNILTAGLISATGNITGGNILGGANVNATTHTGSTVSVTGNITTGADFNIAGNIVDTGALSIITSSNGNITLSPNGTGVIIASKDLLNGQANGVGNIGNSTGYFNTIFAKATSAQYADLAEMYEADRMIEPGTVVCFGGTKEVEICDQDSCRRVAGVVSTNPSYIMNAGLAGDHVVAVALTGRVPTKVTGIIRKGDMLVSTADGRARACTNPAVGAVIGKALADFDGADGVIEVVVGRL